MKTSLLLIAAILISSSSCKTFHLKGGNYIANEMIFGGEDKNTTPLTYLGFAAISPSANSSPLEPYNKVNIKYQPGYFMLNPNPGLNNDGKKLTLTPSQKGAIKAAIAKSYTIDVGGTLSNTQNKKSAIDEQIQALGGADPKTAAIANLTKKSKSLKFQIDMMRFFKKRTNSVKIEITDVIAYFQLDPRKYSVSQNALNKICTDGKIANEEPNAYISEIFQVSATLEFKTTSEFSAGIKASLDNKMQQLKKSTGVDGSVSLKYHSSRGNYHKITVSNAWMLLGTRTFTSKDCPGK